MKWSSSTIGHGMVVTLFFISKCPILLERKKRKKERKKERKKCKERERKREVVLHNSASKHGVHYPVASGNTLLAIFDSV